MTRAAVSILFLSIWLSGCGEPDQPRFIPATGNGPAPGPADRPAGGRSSGEATIPKNIETH